MKFSFLLIFISLFHGENVAKFTLTKDNNSIQINANLDASDIEKALRITDVNSLNTDDLAAYLKTHMSYVINGQITHYKLNDITLNHNHLIISLSIVEKFETINKLQIKNTVLTEINNKQSNVIEVRLNNQSRDFLINKNKPEITIKL